MKTVAVIGCGKPAEGKQGWAIGHAHAGGYLECGEEVRLLGVDLSQENLDAFAEKFNLSEEDKFLSTKAMYESIVPDVVSICTWPKLHHPLFMEAVDKGVKGIICEKPIAVNMGEVDEMYDAARKNGVKVAIAHQRRYSPYLQKLKECFDSGVLGENVWLHAYVGGGWDILSWSSHWFDIANYIYESAPVSILAGMDNKGESLYQHSVESASSIYASYGNDRHAQFISGPGSVFGLKIVGDAGYAVANDNCLHIITKDGYEDVQLHSKDHLGPNQMLAKELLQSLDSDKGVRCSFENCKAATEMAFAAQESFRIGREVRIPFTTKFNPLDEVNKVIKTPLSGKRVTLYADKHFGSGGNIGLQSCLEKLTQNSVNYVDAEANDLPESVLQESDILVIYHTQAELVDTTRQSLENWVNAKKPLLIVHAGLGAYPEWDTYKQWAGYYWKWDTSTHPYEECLVNVKAGHEYELGWSSVCLAKDEVFIKLAEGSEVEILAEADISDGVFPAAWVNKQYPNICAWMPGHREDGWSTACMVQGFSSILLKALKGS